MELVLLMGLPASGKSTFSRQEIFARHTRICGDEMNRPNLKKQLRALESALARGESVIVDGTNLEKLRRASFIALAQAANAKVTGYYFRSNLTECLQRNAAREGRARVPDVALFSGAKALELPKPCEGFAELFHVSLGAEGFTVARWQDDETG